MSCLCVGKDLRVFGRDREEGDVGPDDRPARIEVRCDTEAVEDASGWAEADEEEDGTDWSVLSVRIAISSRDNATADMRGAPAGAFEGRASAMRAVL
jgi:hypothetical protein